MEKLALFVKSYNGHLDHTVQLIDSIREYNVDNIKTYLYSDVRAFHQVGTKIQLTLENL